MFWKSFRRSLSRIFSASMDDSSRWREHRISNTRKESGQLNSRLNDRSIHLQVNAVNLCDDFTDVWIAGNHEKIQQEGYRLKSARSYAVHAKDFLTISENFENFHVESASQPMLQGGGG